MSTRLSVLLVVLAAAARAMGGAPAIEHFVPADKKLPKEWLGALAERGTRRVYRGRELAAIAMPVGGIATGQLYLRGDGTLALWQIFNKHVFSGYGAHNYRHYTPPSVVDSGFAVTVEIGGRTVVKRLNRQDFATVEFLGEYPIGLVRYRDDGFPLRIELEAFSPFIPLNAMDSALPATLFHITVENASTKPVRAGVFGWLENAVCIHSAQGIDALRRSRIVRGKGRTMLVHTAEKAPAPVPVAKPRAKIVLADFEGADYGKWTVKGEALGKGPARGTLPGQQKVSGFRGKGLVNTYLGGDDKLQGTLTSPPFAIARKYLNFLVGGGNLKDRTCMNLVVDGKVVRSATGRKAEQLLWHSWRVADLEGRQAHLVIVDRATGPWGHVNIDQIELADVAASGLGVPLEKLEDYGSMVLALVDAPKAPAPKVDAAYPVSTKRTVQLPAPTAELAPGAKQTYTYALAWHFPNHKNGREYASRFDDAVEVASYVLDKHERLARDTRLWHKTFYEDSTLPRWLLFRLHSTVCNLSTDTCQWWGDGRFWAWEGVGCCAGTCTHVWNYAHAHARLFPQIGRIVREMQDFGAGFDEATGLVGFRSNRAYAADGQCGTVLKAYREHLMSPDRAFLERNWPKIKKALQFSMGRDGNGDGFIEDSQHNTYDINFQGPNTFVGSLYLAALRAGEEMAEEVGDNAFAKQCRAVFESGRKLTLEKLWNGEYFIQLVDLEKHPKHQYGQGCLSDQLFGQGWARLLSLGHVYPPEQVRTTLQSIWKYNWTPDVGPQNAVHKPERWFARPGEAGLFTCTWPKSPYIKAGVRYKNEIWTGIEYQVAGLMAWEGMVTEALAICRGIQDRYEAAKRNPFNEVECGDHYARALASWGVYTNLCGYEHHGPAGHLAFAPRLGADDFRAAFTTAEGWGLFSQTRKGNAQTSRIEVRWGKLRLKTLALRIPEALAQPAVRVGLGPQTRKASHRVTDGLLWITLDDDLTVDEGQSVEIDIR